MSRVATVIKLIPFKVLKKVLVMSTLFAFWMNLGKVSESRAFRADHSMDPTWVNSSKRRVDKRVRLSILKAPPMALMVLELKLIN